MQDIAPKLTKRPRMALVVALIVISALILIAVIVAIVIANNQNSDPSTSTAPADTPSPSPSETAPTDANRISPDTLSQLSPEQLTELMTIPAVQPDGTTTTPEQYAQALIRDLDAFYNSGTAADELAPFKNKPNSDYEDTMQSKYDGPISEGVVSSGSGQLSAEGHRYVLQLASTAYDLDFGRYDYKMTYQSSELSGQVSPEGNFKMKITVHILDTAKGIGLVKFFAGSGKDITPVDQVETYSVSVLNQSGNLKLKSTDVTSSVKN